MTKNTKISKKEYLKAKKIVNGFEKEIRKKRDADFIKSQQKIVGKCYKFHNSYCGSDKWWLYERITGITKDGSLVVELYQTDNNGRSWIEQRTIYSIPSDEYIEITPEEFLEGASGVLKTLSVRVEQ